MQAGGTQGPHSDRRPGAMTVAMRAVGVPDTQGPQVVRVGVVVDGRIVMERIVAADGELTIGRTERSDIVIDDREAPARAVLLRGRGGVYELDASLATGGRLQRPEGPLELSGTDGRIPLDPGTRGMLRVGELVVLLQFVHPPPAMPKPRLPAAVRGQLSRSIDWLFASMLTFSLMSAFGFMVYLQHMDYPMPHAHLVPERLAKFIFVEPEPPPEAQPPKTEPIDQPTSPDPEVAKHEPEKFAPKTPSTPRRDAPSEVNAPRESAVAKANRIRAQAASAASALIAGALSSSNGAIDDLLAGGAVIGNAEDILKAASGVQVASRQDRILREQRGPDSGSGVEISGIKHIGGAATRAERDEGRGPTEREIKAHATLGSGGGDIGGAGVFDASKVVSAIKRRIGAIKSCYERGLKRDPDLAGKLTMNFTIQPTGSVTNVHATNDGMGSPDVVACVAKKLSSLRFTPGPDGGSVTFEYPFVFAPQR